MSAGAHVDHEGNEVEIPWPYLTQKAAARDLGVKVTYLVGLANNPIPAVKTVSDKGNTVWLFSKAAIADLSKIIREHQ